MDEHDDFRRWNAERSDLIRDLDLQGAVTFDVKPGLGFNAKPKVQARRYSDTQYSGTGFTEYDYTDYLGRRH